MDIDLNMRTNGVWQGKFHHRNLASGETSNAKLDFFWISCPHNVYEWIWRINSQRPLTLVKCASLKGGKGQLFEKRTIHIKLVWIFTQKGPLFCIVRLNFNKIQKKMKFVLSVSWFSINLSRFKHIYGQSRCEHSLTLINTS